jgi:hypothetical protein
MVMGFSGGDFSRPDSTVFFRVDMRHAAAGVVYMQRQIGFVGQAQNFRWDMTSVEAVSCSKKKFS